MSKLLFFLLLLMLFMLIMKSQLCVTLKWVVFCLQPSMEGVERADQGLVVIVGLGEV